MKYVGALRRLLANADRVNDLLVASQRIREATENLTDKVIAKTSALREAVTNQSTAANLRLDRINERLDKLQDSTEHLADGLRGVVGAITNQSTAANLRLDRIIAAVRGDDSDGYALSETPPRHDLGTPITAETMKDGPSAEWLSAPSPVPLGLPYWSERSLAEKGISEARIRAPTNALRHYQPLLDALHPWNGRVPEGYHIDFLGILTDAHFGTMYSSASANPNGGFQRTEIPSLQGANGEWWFELVNWLAAAREAREHFVMITLGAFYGAQVVGAYRALEIVNPLPCKLVAVEPVPENYLWLLKHLRDNGIDPNDHWILNAAVSDRNEPVFFPVGGAGSIANCMSTDKPREREIFVEQLISEGKATDTLRSLMLNNTTGIIKELMPGQSAIGEIKLLSAVTLRDLVSAFDTVDYLESDIQQSEERVFPPFLDLLRKKVRRIHIGTHGANNHEMLLSLFADRGWEIIFNYPPDGTYQSEIGAFQVSDGVLTLRNPDL
jgi:hypothetical protein